MSARGDVFAGLPKRPVPGSAVGQLLIAACVSVFAIGALWQLTAWGWFDWVGSMSACPPGQKSISGYANGSYVLLCVQE